MYDKAKIWVEGGAGGNGCISFRREAHVPRGGPDGGDGGHGGDVVLVCDSSKRDLAALKGSKHFRGGRGKHGEGSNRHGGRGEDKEILVPAGTQAEAVDGSRVDLIEAGQRAVVAHAGRGGHGNKRFTSSTRQAPRFAEKGTSGEEGWIELRLEAARRRRPDRVAQRGEVLAAGAADAGGAEGGGLPVHDALAGAGDDRERRPAGDRRRHSGPDRRGGRGRRAGARIPRPRGALRDAGPPGRADAARRRAGGQLRGGAGRAFVVRGRAGPAAGAGRALEAGPAAAGAGGGGGGRVARAAR